MSTLSLPSKPTQNWVVNQWSDLLLIVAAPLLALVWTMCTLALMGTERGTTLVMTVFGVFNVAHHCPTFLRIYGDKELVKRFRWRLLLGPIFPFGCALIVVALLIRSGASVQQMLFLFLLLNLWDPWHFVMQHYGFMRIYDRHNDAPHGLASRMDMLLCFSWFAFVMLAAAEWLPSLLYDMHAKHGVGLILLFDGTVELWIERLAMIIAASSTLAYVVYLAWCRTKGFYISPAKVALMLITFGVMYFTYVPNRVMQSIIEGWTFPVGFATIGMVHVSQYLAIVWKYNRSLATRQDGELARQGWFPFRSFFRHGGWLLVSAYVALCLAYGAFVSGTFLAEGFLSRYTWYSIEFASTSAFSWISGVLIATLFTSNFLHYYYDGFIWKVRHRENRANLEMTDQTSTSESSRPLSVRSWWDANMTSGPLPTLFRQTVYFAPPLLFLIVTFWMVNREETQAPMQLLGQSVSQFRDGRADGSRVEPSLAAAKRQLEVQRRMAEMSSDAHHLTYKADLQYHVSWAQTSLVMLDRKPSAAELEAHRRNIIEARNDLEAALEASGELAHREWRTPEQSRGQQREFVKQMIAVLDLEAQQLAAGVIPESLFPSTP